MSVRRWKKMASSWVWGKGNPVGGVVNGMHTFKQVYLRVTVASSCVPLGSNQELMQMNAVSTAGEMNLPPQTKKQ